MAGLPSITYELGKLTVRRIQPSHKHTVKFTSCQLFFATFSNLVYQEFFDTLTRFRSSNDIRCNSLNVTTDHQST